MGMNNGYGLDAPVSPETMAQINYEADLLNRISVLGYTTPEAARKAAKEIYAVIKRTHDESERKRLLGALERLDKDHGVVLDTREQVDHLLTLLRANDWEGLNAEVVIPELKRIAEMQRQGEIVEIDAYDIMGKDVRPYLESLWSNEKGTVKIREQALEAAKRLDIVRMLYKTKALNALAGKKDTPQLTRDLMSAQSIASSLATQLGVGQDMDYTLGMFKISAEEMAQLHVAAETQDAEMLRKGTEAEIILTQGNPEMDQLITVSFYRDQATRWLIGGAFCLALGYILRGRGA